MFGSDYHYPQVPSAPSSLGPQQIAIPIGPPSHPQQPQSLQPPEAPALPMAMPPPPYSQSEGQAAPPAGQYYQQPMYDPRYGAPMQQPPMQFQLQPPQQQQLPQQLQQPQPQVQSQLNPQAWSGYGYAHPLPPPYPPTGPSGGGGTVTRGPYFENVYTSAKPIPTDRAGGGEDLPSHGLFEETTVANAPMALRLGFIRKVYGIVTAQLAFSLAVIALMQFHEGVRTFVQSNVILMWIAIAGTIVIAVAMACVPSLHQNYPQNMAMLALFTAFQGYLLGAVSSFYNTTAVMQAVLVTAVITLALTMYAMQTKRDLSKMGSFLFVALICLIMFGFLRLLFPVSPIVETVYASLGALIFSAYLVYDTWLIANVLGPDDYVIAALRIYLDIINIFLFLLQLMGGRRR